MVSPLIAHPAPGVAPFGLAWSCDARDGQAIVAYILPDKQLYISASGALKTCFRNDGKNSVWKPPYVFAPSADGVNVAIHPGSHRAQIWFSRVGDAKTHEVTAMATSASGGIQPDWTPPVSLPNGQFQPIEPLPIVIGGIYAVTSQSLGGLTWEVGANGRLYSSTNYFATDNTGALWQAGDYSGPYNSFGGAPSAPVDQTPPQNVHAAHYPVPGRSQAQMLRLAVTPLQSNIIRSKNGTLYRLVFTNRYSRVCKVYPRPGTATAAPHGNLLTNAGGAGLPTPGAVALNYRMDVPDVAATPVYARWNWQQELYARAPIAGVLDNPGTPAKVTFAIPRLENIAPGRITAARVVANFTYKNAKNLTLQIGRKYTPADPSKGVAASGDPPPSPALPAPFVGATGTPIEGRGEYGAQPFPLPYLDHSLAFPLSLARVAEIDAARGANVSFDIGYPIGSVESVAWKGCWLFLEYLANLGMTYPVVALVPTLSGVTALPVGVAGQVQEPEIGAEAVASGLYAPGITVNDGLLASVAASRGSAWDFDLSYTPGRDPFTFSSSTYQAMLDQYAQLSYPVSASDVTRCDWFLLRSRDGGATWEFAANAAPIAGLAAMRDLNLGGTLARMVMPSLMTDDDNLYLVWAQGAAGGHPVQMLGSQDAGETWQAGASFLPSSH